MTNDDGIDAPGVRVLAQVAVAAGLDVLVAAPHEERSGSGAGLSALEEGGRLIHEPRQWPELAGSSARVMSVEASPAMIAMLACRGALGAVPDLVLSGVNNGQNTGHMVLHSGTVNAALTAAYHGVPGLAVSQAAERPRHWETAAVAAQQVLAWMLASFERPSGSSAGNVAPVDAPLSAPLTVDGRALAARTLSVNVPDIPVGQLRGIRQARLARFGTVRADVTEFGERHSTLTFRREPVDPEPGAEEECLRAGYASVTALRGPSELAMEFGPLEL